MNPEIVNLAKPLSSDGAVVDYDEYLIVLYAYLCFCLCKFLFGS